MICSKQELGERKRTIGLGARIVDTIRTFPLTSARWGKFLVSLMAIGWALPLLHDPAFSTHWRAMQFVLNLLGVPWTGLIMLVIGVGPICVIFTNSIWMRFVSTNLASAFWLWLLICGFWLGDDIWQPGSWNCIICICAMVNADAALAREVLGRGK